MCIHEQTHQEIHPFWVHEIIFLRPVEPAPRREAQLEGPCRRISYDSLTSCVVIVSKLQKSIPLKSIHLIRTAIRSGTKYSLIIWGNVKLSSKTNHCQDGCSSPGLANTKHAALFSPTPFSQPLLKGSGALELRGSLRIFKSKHSAILSLVWQ